MKKNLVRATVLLIPIFWFAGTSQADIFRPDLSAGLDLKYSDNVIYIYNIDTAATTTDADFIYEPFLTFHLKKKDPLYSQKLSFFLSSDFYSRYSPLNYQTYSFFYEQGIGEKAYLTLKYSLNPYLFVGEEEVSGTGPNVIDTSWAFRLQTFSLSVDKDLVHGINLYLFGKQALKDFNAPLAFRTAITNTFGGDLTFHLNRPTILLIGLFYEINESRKGIRSISTLNPPTFNDNSDYTSPGINLMIIHHFSSKETFRVKYIFKSRDFTADSHDPLYDSLHVGRNDRINNLVLANTMKLAPQWSWKLSYELFKRDSNQSYAVYTENSLTTGLEYLF